MGSLARVVPRTSVRILMNTEWDLAVSKFFIRLRDTLGDALVGVVIPGEEVYESNVLVIVRRRSPEVVTQIMRIKREVEEEFMGRISISPYIALEGEEHVIRAFKEGKTEDRIDAELLEKALEAFREKLTSLDPVVGVVIPGEEVYESNVLVIVRRRSPEVVTQIMRIKREVEEEFMGRISISPYIALEGEEHVIRAFKETTRGSSQGP